MAEDPSRVGQAYRAAKTAKRINEVAKTGRMLAFLLNPATLGALAIGAVVFIIAIIVMLVIVGSSAASPSGGSGVTGGSSGAIPGIADISDIEIKAVPCGSGSAAGGCYQLPPKTQYWEAYEPPDHLTGTKCLVQLIAGTSKAWKQKYPDDVIHVGDMNAPGHLSHQLGVDVDISTDRAANMTTPGYSRERSVEYGDLWFSTKQIEYIFFNDAPVREKVNSYAQKNHLPGIMEYWPNHEDHYHVRVTPDSHGECSSRG